MYGDTKTKKDRMSKVGKPASGKIGQMVNQKHQASKVKAMAKVLNKAK